jgi:hypothetical protein
VAPRPHAGDARPDRDRRDLEPSHIGLAIEDARPYGVDLLAEVEIAPGKKDLDRLELVLDAVRRAERRIHAEGATAD